MHTRLSQIPIYILNEKLQIIPLYFLIVPHLHSIVCINKKIEGKILWIASTSNSKNFSLENNPPYDHDMYVHIYIFMLVTICSLIDVITVEDVVVSCAVHAQPIRCQLMVMIDYREHAVIATTIAFHPNSKMHPCDQ